MDKQGHIVMLVPIIHSTGLHHSAAGQSSSLGRRTGKSGKPLSASTPYSLLPKNG